MSTRDGAVDIEDAALVVAAFGTNTAKYDVNGDGSVGYEDLLLIIAKSSSGSQCARLWLG